MMPVAGGQSGAFLPTTGGSLISMAVDSTNFYYTELTNDAFIKYVPLANNTLSYDFAPPGTESFGVATGGGFVVWHDAIDNTIKAIHP